MGGRSPHNARTADFAKTRRIKLEDVRGDLLQSAASQGSALAFGAGLNDAIDENAIRDLGRFQRLSRFPGFGIVVRGFSLRRQQGLSRYRRHRASLRVRRSIAPLTLKKGTSDRQSRQS
jgi:hypothetical protein